MARGAGRPGRPWTRRVLIILGTVGLAVAALGLVARYHAPGSIVPLALAALSPYLMSCAVVAGVLFAIARGTVGWAGLALCTVLVVVAVAGQVPLFVAETVPPGGRDVVVLTANLRLGSADPHAVVAAVRAHHVDVLMLEELTTPELAALKAAGLDGELPYGEPSARNNASGTGLFSRYPLDGARIDYDFAFSLVTARVRIPGVSAEPSVVALHVFGPYPARYTAEWAAELGRLPRLLAAQVGPVLVGGDFNATIDVPQFRGLLRNGYADATEQAGAGFTPTYPADRAFPPLLAIDHVLTRGAVAHSVDSIELPGSDHRGLLVTVRLP